MKSPTKPRAAKSQKPAAGAPNPFPTDTFVEIVVGKRKPRAGQIAQRVDATHWRVELATGGSALATEKQLRQVEPPAAAAPAGKPAKARRQPQPPRGRHAELLAAAQQGALPPPPDFTAETHKPYRKRLAALVALVEAGDLAGLEAAELPPPRSTSPKALHRYRDLATTALKARAAAGAGEIGTETQTITLGELGDTPEGQANQATWNSMLDKAEREGWPDREGEDASPAPDAA